MTTKSTKQLRTALDAAIMGYLRKFEEVQGVTVEYAVGDDLLGIFEVADAYLSINDIVYDIDNKLPIGLIFEWFWAGLDADNRDENIPQINLRSYASGLRFKGQE
jgi:predicted transglutaminase-like protease